MIRKEEKAYYPHAMTKRWDGTVVSGRLTVASYYEGDHHFPVAYEVRDTGPYLEEGHERSEYAHYHPLALGKQPRINLVK